MVKMIITEMKLSSLDGGAPTFFRFFFTIVHVHKYLMRRIKYICTSTMDITFSYNYYLVLVILLVRYQQFQKTFTC